MQTLARVRGFHIDPVECLALLRAISTLEQNIQENRFQAKRYLVLETRSQKYAEYSCMTDSQSNFRKETLYKILTIHLVLRIIAYELKASTHLDNN